MSVLKLGSFRQTLSDIDPKLLHPESIDTLQVNVGNLCNQTCVHCHVSASPNGKQNMDKETFVHILEALKIHSIKTVDITGGAPEMNPHFRWFVDEALGLGVRVMVRTNLTVFFEPHMDDFPEWYANRNIELVASLPCYEEENVDAQRGEGVFEKSIKALQMLNVFDYGSKHDLSLVYNPGSDVLPGSQVVLEKAYRRELQERYGIEFSRLYVLANLAVGRFKHYLRKEKRLETYEQLLKDNFNADSASQVMCRFLISIDWNGLLYHCDFNQQERLPIRDAKGVAFGVDRMNEVIEQKGEIITGSHCFGCTAGAGSSCTGSLVA